MKHLAFLGLAIAMLALGACSHSGTPTVSGTPVTTVTPEQAGSAAGVLVGAITKQTAGQKFTAAVVKACGWQPAAAVVNGVIGALAGSLPYATVGASALTSAEKAVCDVMVATANVPQNAFMTSLALSTEFGGSSGAPTVYINGKTIALTGTWVK